MSIELKVKVVEPDPTYETIRKIAIGPYTIAHVVMHPYTDGIEGKFKEVHGFGLAIQSKEDKFSRTKGEVIAEGRAKKAISLKIKGKPLNSNFMA